MTDGREPPEEGGESDDGGVLVEGPWGGGDSSYIPPPIASYDDIVPPDTTDSESEADPQAPAIPEIPQPMDPSEALRSEESPLPAPPPIGEEETTEEKSSRSLADRIGDFLEHRLEKSRSRQEVEAPYRKAEVERKVALLKSRTAADVAALEGNSKMQSALTKADADRTGARSGLHSPAGADKGRGRNSGGTPHNHRSPGTGSGGGGGKPGAPGGHGDKSRTKPGKDREKPSHRDPGGRSGPHGGKGAPGGPGGPHKGTDGSRNSKPPRDGKTPDSKRSPDKAKDESGKHQTKKDSPRGLGPHKPGERPWRDRKTPDPSSAAGKDPDRASAGGKKDSPRNAKTAEKGSPRVVDPHKPGERPWKERRSRRDEGNREAGATPRGSKDTRSKSDRASRGGGMPPPRVVDPHKPGERPWKERRSPSNGSASDAASGSASGSASAGPDAEHGSRTESEETSENQNDEREETWKAFWDEWFGPHAKRGRKRRAADDQTANDAASGPVSAESVGWTIERDDAEARNRQAPFRSDAGSPRNGESRTRNGAPRAVGNRLRGLPRAKEPHTVRPGTTRPPDTEPGPRVDLEKKARVDLTKHKEEKVTTPTPRSPATSSPPATQQRAATRRGNRGRLATKHRTDISLDEYLVVMTNVAFAAGEGREMAWAISYTMRHIAEAVQEIAKDVADDHNIAPQLAQEIEQLAEKSRQMQAEGKKAEEDCQAAYDAAKATAKGAARVYREDQDAVRDAGLDYASAAAHHN